MDICILNIPCLSLKVLIYSLKPSDIIVAVRDQMNVQVLILFLKVLLQILVKVAIMLVPFVARYTLTIRIQNLFVISWRKPIFKWIRKC